MSTETTPRDLLTPSLLEPIPLLDHGFLRLVDAMPRLVTGDETADHAIVRAARVSTAGGSAGTKGATADRGLIRYLMRHGHTSPFEMVELKFHAKLPIFVARQWIRHRTASVNEVSARYSVLPEEVYVPAPEHIGTQATANRQGSGGAHQHADVIAAAMGIDMRRSHILYSTGIEQGVARETARVVLPVATYTEWYWKANLLNVFRFLHLRMDSHAQYEIRVYAEAMARLVRAVAPWSFEAFKDYWQGSPRLSAREWAVVRAVLTPEQSERIVATLEADAEVSAGEVREWRDKVGR